MLSYSEIKSSRTWDLVLRVSVKTACSEGCKDRTDSKASLKDKTGVQNIINISSTYGVKAQDQKIYSSNKFKNKMFKPLEYAVSKSGLESFTRNLAAYYQNTNIRVNTLSPGGIEQPNQNKTFKNNYTRKTILGRMATLEDYNDSILFLCKKTNNYLTGANLVVDGGATVI